MNKKLFFSLVKQFLLITIITIFISSCTKSTDTITSSTTTNVANKLDTLNVAYGTEATQKMDIDLSPEVQAPP